MTTTPSDRAERRRYPRSVVGIPVEAVRRDLAEGDPGRVLGLHVTDLSRGGVGAASQRALPTAEPLVLFFPPLGSGRGMDTPGRVTRCQDRGDHWNLGIAFDELLASEEPVKAI